MFGKVVMYKVKEKLHDGRVVLLGVVETEDEARRRVEVLKRTGRRVYYVKE